MKVAMVTPLPPQHTGIADYVSDLLQGLITNKNFEITIISNANINSIHHCEVHSYKDYPDEEYHAFDLIVYQIGNNYEFHGYMLDLIRKFGGIIHLHDVVLHHLFASMLWENNKRDEYFYIIEEHYGVDTLKSVKEKVSHDTYPWEGPEVIDLPLFEEFIQFCDGCIVHSEFAKTKISDLFPALDVYRINQLYKMDVKTKKPEENKIIKFAIFGGVDPQKKVDIVLKVFTKIKKINKDASFLLTIVGGINDQAKYELDLLIKDHLTEHVKITGRVDEKEFMEYFLDTDILIALRYPTMGETSAVVMRAMQLGIPCIVNDIGWYSELPEHIMKIPIDTMEAELESTILEILNDEKRLKWLKKETLKYSKEELDFDKSIEEYSNIIMTIYNNQADKLIYRQLGLVMDDLKYMDDPKIYTPVINKIIDIIQ